MSDNTNDTYVDEDADGTPCLWLRTSDDRPATPALLLSKDELRWAVKRNKPAYWGAPTWEEHVDRLWDAIASTVRPSVGESARAESAPAEGAAIDALVTEFAPWDGIIQRQRLRAFAAHVLEVGGQQSGVPVEKVRESTPEQVEAKPADECLAHKTLGATPHVCLLPPGHEGDHQWTADRETPEPTPEQVEAEPENCEVCGGSGLIYRHMGGHDDCNNCDATGQQAEAASAPGVLVTDEMVEAEARKRYGFDWEHETPRVQNKWRALAHASLEAARLPKEPTS